MAPGRKITPLRRDDIPELSQFLIGGFGVPATSSYFSHDVLSWKYFDGPASFPGSAWERTAVQALPAGTVTCAESGANRGGASNAANSQAEPGNEKFQVPHRAESPCSLIARSAGKIVAHLGICFRQFVVPGNDATPVSTMHAIDWLGSAEHPGSGSLLMLEAFKTCKTQFAVGGSTESQALFPRLGFEPKGRVASFRRVLSPLHRLRTTDQRLFRRWAGATKDAAAVWRACMRACVWPAPQTVELRPVTEFTADIDSLVRQSSLRIVRCQRDHQLLNYLLRYPRSGFSAFTIHAPRHASRHDSGRMIGFALLKVTPHGRIQFGKIVDCWLDTDDASCWQAAVAALIDQLRAESADDVKCYATHPILHAALLANGFSKSGESNVCVRDTHHLLPRDLPFGLSGFEADGAIV